MKKSLFASSLFLFLMIAISLKSTAQFEPFAVIELFTSQGCSSCPSADGLLSRTIAEAKINNKKIYALSFHVDYWNRLGWTDPFSDKKYSERQEVYANSISGSSVYTPQMVVNGSIQFVGSSSNELNNALTKSLNTKPVAIFKSLTATLVAGKAPKIKYALEGDIKGCKINFALISLNEITAIKRGENGGKSLMNENVVRQFISKEATISGEIDFNILPMPDKSNMAIIAYIQNSNNLKILAATMAEQQ